MKKKLIGLAVCTSIFLAACGDPVARQEEKLAFNDENYTYNESIREADEYSSINYYSKEYESVLTDKDSTVPTLQVRYDVVSDVAMGNGEYWHYSEPQGVIRVTYDGELEKTDGEVNELAKPIIEHMSDSGMLHPEYGLDFVKTRNRHTDSFLNPLIYNNGSTEGFEIKDSGTEHGYTTK